MQTFNIVDLIPKGRENAITRENLRTITGLNDRTLRQEIEDARSKGALIFNEQDGNGYYTSDEISDIARQYRQNENRAMSILVQQKYLRRRLKEAGALVGRKVVISTDGNGAES